jgi:hypothetical protein
MAPAAFGAAPSWAWATLTCGFALAAAAWGAAVLRGWAEPLPMARPVAWSLAALVAAVLVAAMHAVPGLPGAHPLWAATGAALETPVAAGTAVDPKAAAAALAGLLGVLTVVAVVAFAVAAALLPRTD